jgi:hypothetical protein
VTRGSLFRRYWRELLGYPNAKETAFTVVIVHRSGTLADRYLNGLFGRLPRSPKQSPGPPQSTVPLVEIRTARPSTTAYGLGGKRRLPAVVATAVVAMAVIVGALSTLLFRYSATAVPPGSGGDVVHTATPKTAPQPFFEMVVGPACPGNLQAHYFQVTDANNGDGTGWINNIKDRVGSDCEATFDAMPMSGVPQGAPDSGPNRGLWLFGLPQATSATCTVVVYIPDPPSDSLSDVGGTNAYYTVDEGTVSTPAEITEQVAFFSVNQVSNRGSSVAKTFHITENYIAVRLDDTGETTSGAMYGVGAVRLLCVQD